MRRKIRDSAGRQVAATADERAELERMEALAREIGGVIGRAVDVSGLGGRVGFTLLLHGRGPGGFITYISNAEREGMKAMLRELISVLGGGEADGKPDGATR